MAHPGVLLGEANAIAEGQMTILKDVRALGCIDRRLDRLWI